MSRIIKKIICIFIICTLIIINYGINTYAATTEEELIQLLNEYKDELGDINEFKKVVDKTYQDLSSATEINDELKEKLKADVDELANVPDINPLVLQVLDVELKSQIENLDESNIEEMKDELSIIKQWAETNSTTNVTDNGTNDNEKTNTNGVTIPSNNIDQSYANKILPYAGRISTIIIFTAILVLVVNAIVLKIKYGQFKGIK